MGSNSTNEKSIKYSFNYIRFILAEMFIFIVWALYIFGLPLFFGMREDENIFVNISHLVKTATPESLGILISGWAFIAMFFALKMQSYELYLQRVELDETRKILRETKVETNRLAGATEKYTEIDKYNLMTAAIDLKINQISEFIEMLKSDIRNYKDEYVSDGHISQGAKQFAKDMRIGEDNVVEISPNQFKITLEGKKQQLQLAEFELVNALQVKILLYQEIDGKYINPFLNSRNKPNNEQ